MDQGEEHAETGPCMKATQGNLKSWQWWRLETTGKGTWALGATLACMSVLTQEEEELEPSLLLQLCLPALLGGI